ncbi:hypothetical protein K525DRAFT_284214 [Schizophyllum commune Loenen D]|nr:hypothetical protein K525DRAFT_284214 [Schizophyllum commune Loenen D]
MPPTSDPQARLKTAPGRVLFHAPFRVYMRRKVALKVCGNVRLPMHRVNTDRTVFKIVRRLSRCFLLWLSPLTSRRRQPTPLSYIVRKFSRSKTLRACLKRLVCLKIPWDRCAAGGRCTGARPHRGPRVNPTRFEGGGQLVFESGSEREVCLLPCSYFIVADHLLQSDAIE